MKKSFSRFAVIALLASASLLSYIYLATRTTVDSPVVIENKSEGLPKDDGISGEKSTRSLLLDIELVKKVASATRRLLPASSY
ncbi:MAG: hypothetical protein KF852_19430 [Saprospiraceae bacterium]|nr:hypothetical protein [Saprospiraceae bacterium]